MVTCTVKIGIIIFSMKFRLFSSLQIAKVLQRLGVASPDPPEIHTLIKDVRSHRPWSMNKASLQSR